MKKENEYVMKRRIKNLESQNNRFAKRNSELRAENFELKDTIKKMREEYDKNNDPSNESYCKDIIGCNMRMFRKERKITQYRMASLIGVSTHTLSDAEHGRIYLNMEAIIIFCNTVKIPMTYLFKKYDECDYTVP